MYKAYLMAIDSSDRLIIEDVRQSDNKLFRDHCWLKDLNPTELATAKAILSDHGSNATIYFYGEPYEYINKQATKINITNITNLTDKDPIMKQPTNTTISRRINHIIIKLFYPSVNSIITNLITSLTPSAHSLVTNSSCITVTYEFEDVQEASLAKLDFAVHLRTCVEDVFNYAEHLITGVNPTEHKSEPIVEPTPTADEVQVFVKLPKSIRVFNAWEDISAIHTTSGIISRTMLPLHNTEQLAVPTSAKRIAYRIGDVVIPSDFITEVTYSLSAKFNCEYEPSEFLRIEDNCIVIQRDNEVILLSNAIMQLHGQSTDVILNDSLHYFPDDTEFANPISKQIVSTKRITNKSKDQ